MKKRAATSSSKQKQQRASPTDSVIGDDNSSSSSESPALQRPKHNNNNNNDLLDKHPLILPSFPPSPLPLHSHSHSQSHSLPPPPPPSSSSSSSSHTIWTQCPTAEFSNQQQQQQQQQEVPDLFTDKDHNHIGMVHLANNARVLWHDEGVGRTRSELDCFLLCFPTQLIPSLCQSTSVALTASSDNIGLENVSSTGTYTPSDALTERELFRYLSVALGAAIESRSESCLFRELWATQTDGVRLAPDFGKRFGMTLERFDQINNSLKVGNHVNLMGSIKHLLDGVNYKRKSAIYPGENLRLDDLIAVYHDLQHVTKCDWMHDVDWNSGLSTKPVGIIKSLTDVESGVCVGLYFVKVDDSDLSDKSQFRDRSCESIVSMVKPFIEIPRTIFCTEMEVVCYANVAAIAEKGVNVVARVSSGFHGLSVPSDLKINESRDHSILLKTPLRAAPSSNSKHNSDELFLLLPKAPYTDCYLFNTGSTVNIKQKPIQNHMLDCKDPIDCPKVVAQLSHIMNNKKFSDLIVSRNMVEGTSNQSLLVSLLHIVAIQSAIDAFNVFNLQERSTTINYKVQLRNFVSKLAKSLLEKATENLVSDVSNPIVSTSTPHAAIQVNNSAEIDASTMLINAQEQHRLLPLCKLAYYEEHRLAGKRAKRRCKICHHPTGFYCLHCSNVEQEQFYGICHPTTKPDSRCYYEHMHQ